MMTEDRMLLVGCGILEKEVGMLIEKNRWPLEAVLREAVMKGMETTR